MLVGVHHRKLFRKLCAAAVYSHWLIHCNCKWTDECTHKDFFMKSAQPLLDRHASNETHPVNKCSLSLTLSFLFPMKSGCERPPVGGCTWIINGTHMAVRSKKVTWILTLVCSESCTHILSLCRLYGVASRLGVTLLFGQMWASWDVIRPSLSGLEPQQKGNVRTQASLAYLFINWFAVATCSYQQPASLELHWLLLNIGTSNRNELFACMP